MEEILTGKPDVPDTLSEQSASLLVWASNGTCLNPAPA